MSEKELFEKLAGSVLNCNIDETKAIAKEVVEHGVDPVKAIENGLAQGLKAVGDKFGDGEVFLTELMMAAEAMHAGLEVLKPGLAKSRSQIKSSGKIVIGTVKSDIHDIGKNIVAALLVANGFEVIDLGADVPVDTFVEVVKKEKPDIVALSALLTVTMPEQKKVVDALKNEGLGVKVLVGGGQVTEEWAKEIGADGTANTASEAVTIARKVLNK